jgi:hypothetical protein
MTAGQISSDDNLRVADTRELLAVVILYASQGVRTAGARISSITVSAFHSYSRRNSFIAQATAW